MQNARLCKMQFEYAIYICRFRIFVVMQFDATCNVQCVRNVYKFNKVGRNGYSVGRNAIPLDETPIPLDETLNRWTKRHSVGRNAIPLDETLFRWTKCYSVGRNAYSVGRNADPLDETLFRWTKWTFRPTVSHFVQRFSISSNEYPFRPTI